MKVNGELRNAGLEYSATDPTSDDFVGRIVMVGDDPRIRKAAGWTNLIAGTTSNAAIDWNGDGPTPLFTNLNGLELMEYPHTGGEYVWCTIKVPSNYTAGEQIQLQGGIFASKATGDVKMQCTTYLVQTGTTDITSITNTHDSTNAKVTVGTANQATSIGNIDLTDASGEINSTAVAAGDTLLVKLFRDTANEQTKTNDDVQVFRYSFIPNFGS